MTDRSVRDTARDQEPEARRDEERPGDGGQDTPPGESKRALREEPPQDETRDPDGNADAQDEDADDEDADDEAAPQPSILRRHPVWFGLGALAVVVLGIAGYVFWLIELRPYESTDDAFVDARTISVAPKVGGYLVAVPVTDNQHVEAGQTLFQIYQADYRIALDLAEAQVQAAEATIRNDDAQVQEQYAQIDAAKAQVENTKAALVFAQQDAARYRDLAQKGAGTIQQSQSTNSTLEQRQAQLVSANAAVEAAQKQIGVLQATRATAQAQLGEAKAQRDQAKLNLNYTTVTAAQAGRVVRLTGGIGELAQAGQNLSMFVPDDVWITANYKETQITDIRPGQPVSVEIDAYPNRKITGRVASVQPGSGTAFSLLPAQNATGNYVKVVQRIPVKIVVDDWPKDVSIGPGMSIVPTIRVR